MSQEEHILHTLKEMREWTANVDKQCARIKWALYVLTIVSISVLVLAIFKR